MKACSHDHDKYAVGEGRTYTDQAFTVPHSWRMAIIDIMALPVSDWNDPGTVSGEINTEKRTKTMSNPMDDFFNAPFDDFDHTAGNNPKPHEGKQIAMLKAYGPKQTQKKGNIMTADLIIVQPAPGSTYAQGSLIKLAWFVNESDTTKRRYERKRSDEFISGLLGLPAKTQCGPHAARLSQPDQVGRGILVAVYGERNGQWLNFRYEHIKQSGEQIAGNKAVLDRMDASSNGLPAQPQHMQQAPHPAQMTQQYPAQNITPSAQQHAPQSLPYNAFGGMATAQPANAPAPVTGPTGIPGFKW